MMPRPIRVPGMASTALSRCVSSRPGIPVLTIRPKTTAPTTAPTKAPTIPPQNRSGRKIVKCQMARPVMTQTSMAMSASPPVLAAFLAGVGVLALLGPVRAVAAVAAGRMGRRAAAVALGGRGRRRGGAAGARPGAASAGRSLARWGDRRPRLHAEVGHHLLELLLADALRGIRSDGLAPARLLRDDVHRRAGRRDRERGHVTELRQDPLAARAEHR